MIDLGLTEQQFLQSTLRQIDSLQTRRDARDAVERDRHAVLMATLHNAHFTREDGRRWSAFDFGMPKPLETAAQRAAREAYEIAKMNKALGIFTMPKWAKRSPSLDPKPRAPRKRKNVN